MYSKKYFLKKKNKNSGTKNGSEWGPRVAIIEREKILQNAQGCSFENLKSKPIIKYSENNPSGSGRFSLPFDRVSSDEDTESISTWKSSVSSGKEDEREEERSEKFLLVQNPQLTNSGNRQNRTSELVYEKRKVYRVSPPLPPSNFDYREKKILGGGGGGKCEKENRNAASGAENEDHHENISFFHSEKNNNPSSSLDSNSNTCEISHFVETHNNYPLMVKNNEDDHTAGKINEANNLKYQHHQHLSSGEDAICCSSTSIISNKSDKKGNSKSKPNTKLSRKSILNGTYSIGGSEISTNYEQIKYESIVCPAPPVRKSFFENPCHHHHQEDKDPDADSLLGTFSIDSNIFQPKSTTSWNSSNSNNDKNSPPPLPPKNILKKNISSDDKNTAASGLGNKKNKKELSFHIIDKSESPSTSFFTRNKDDNLLKDKERDNICSNKEKKGNKKKKVGLLQLQEFGKGESENDLRFVSTSTVNNHNNNNKNVNVNHLNHNLKHMQNMHANANESTGENEIEPDGSNLILSCGHLQQNYNTISTVSTEEGVSSEGNSNSNPNENEQQKLPSAIQQLKDLSLLIHSNSFLLPDDEECDNGHLRNANYQRKNSVAFTDTSGTTGDSGKGSEQCKTSNSPNSSSELASESPDLTDQNSISCNNNEQKKREIFVNTDSIRIENEKNKHNFPAVGILGGKKRSKNISFQIQDTNIKNRNSSEQILCDCMFIYKCQNNNINSECKMAELGSNLANSNSNDMNMLFTINEEEMEEEGEPSFWPKIKEIGFNNHSHPNCWLANDSSMGWSDLESLYSQSLLKRGKVAARMSQKEDPYCLTCWKELLEEEKAIYNDRSSSPNSPNCGTTERTKMMFKYINKRNSFSSSWWEAKKRASISWLNTKAFVHLPASSIQDAFKDSSEKLTDEIRRGLTSGRLYCMALDNLYFGGHNNEPFSYNKKRLSHWEIIKILSRKGVYIAQPSDMKLTEGTLKQKKPLRIAAHIALIEAIMGLYTKEMLNREKIYAILRTLDYDLNSHCIFSMSFEQLIIAWVNSTITKLKSFVLNSKKMPANILNRWMNVPRLEDLRDLCDGIGICSLLALYLTNDIKIKQIFIPKPGEILPITQSIENHKLIQSICGSEIFPEKIYHFSITDFLYIHGCMKQNILCFLIDLFNYFELNPVSRVNRLSHVPIHIDL